MKRVRQAGLTLVETLLSVAVMGIILSAGYSTIQESLKLHRLLLTESAFAVDRCVLAERLASDIHQCRRFQPSPTSSLEITRSNDSVVRYVIQPNSVFQIELGQPPFTNLYAVGPVEVSFRADRTGWEKSLLHGVPAKALRLKFSNSEVIVAR